MQKAAEKQKAAAAAASRGRGSGLSRGLQIGLSLDGVEGGRAACRLSGGETCKLSCTQADVSSLC